MTTHTTDKKLREYLSATLAPAALLEVDDHLAGCDGCRERLMILSDPREKLAQLLTDLWPVDSHLSEEDVQHYASGEMPGAQRKSSEEHLRECVMCASEVNDLRSFVRTNAPRTRAWYFAAAAAAILIAIATSLLWRDPGSAIGSAGSLAGLDSLPAAYQQNVRTALDAGVAEPAPILSEMGGEPETLMGGMSAAKFRLTAPLRTVTVSDRPTFRWEPLAAAGESIVKVFDTNGTAVARSPSLTAAEWTPVVALPRDRTYVWQVTMRNGDATVTEPAPPAPLATFHVLDGRTAALLARTESQQPESHLLLGVLFTQAGAREQAEGHLRKVSPEDPHAAVARASLNRLRAARSMQR